MDENNQTENSNAANHSGENERGQNDQGENNKNENEEAINGRGQEGDNEGDDRKGEDKEKVKEERRVKIHRKAKKRTIRVNIEIGITQTEMKGRETRKKGTTKLKKRAAHKTRTMTRMSKNKSIMVILKREARENMIQKIRK